MPETLVPEFSLTMKVSDFALGVLERSAELELWQLLIYIVCVLMLYCAVLCLIEQLVQSSIGRSSFNDQENKGREKNKWQMQFRFAAPSSGRRT